MHCAKTYDGKIAGLYDLEETLGRGHFAVVKLARHVFTGEKVAVKVIDKTKLDDVSRSHLFQEVRCMKLVQHPNVVRLYEVIDTQTKLYLILELGDGGDLYDYIMKHESGLGEDRAREYFRQIVRAISYCHQLHVVHRDLKPENVVFFERLGIVKLTDFGFSNKFCPGQKLETSCGSLAYSAPEILLGDSYDAPAVDVWSLGVILYMLVVGQAPFQEANDSETLTMIMDCRYTIPGHVSSDCKHLIGRMLVREPESRATLSDIAADPWLGGVTQSELLPLVSRHHVSEDGHNLIVNKMVNGNIATKDEILDALDRNEYNHITATYYLLAERKLRSDKIEQVQNKSKQNQLNKSIELSAANVGTNDATGGLSIPAQPGDNSVQGRIRKCSIVQEEDDDEDVVGNTQELTPPHSSLNRRGSRSEGKLNIVVQERLAEERRRELPSGKMSPQASVPPPVIVTSINNHMGARDDAPYWNNNNNTSYLPNTTKWRMGANKNSPGRRKDKCEIPTVCLTESSTITIPVSGRGLSQDGQDVQPTAQPQFMTMPSPTRISHSFLSSPQLNEICEEGVFEVKKSNECCVGVGESERRSRMGITGINYEQRRSKFHKARTASCSSSDASDDDSESRKKRAHKISTRKNSQRRDSHDDSSDSQDPGGAGSGGGGGSSNQSTADNTSHHPSAGTSSDNQNHHHQQQQQQQQEHNSRQRQDGGRTRRRAGETRLRESQSLNRITEVQETHETCTERHVQTTVAAGTSVKVTKSSFGARLLHSLSSTGSSGRKHDKKSAENKFCSEEKENKNTSKVFVGRKKVKLLGKYFQVSKKLCLPLPSLVTRGRLYKARSCGSIVKDRITSPTTTSPQTVQDQIKLNHNNLTIELSVLTNTSVCGVSPARQCPKVGVCKIHMVDAAKCHLS